MDFNKLNTNEKEKVVKEYIEGWKETHPSEILTIKEATELCIDSEGDI